MTRLLEEAFAQVREPPEEDQDSITVMLLSVTSNDPQMDPVGDATRTAILEGLAQARRGEFVPDAEIEAIWRRHGV